MDKPSGLTVLFETLACGCHLSGQTADDTWYNSAMIKWCQLSPTEEHQLEVSKQLSDLKKKVRDKYGKS